MDDEQWLGLRGAMGDPEWARDVELRREAGRLERHDELDARIGDWTSTQDDYELMHLLQSHGVPAAPVLDSSRIYDDRHVQHRRLNEARHLFDDIGSFRYNTPFMRFSETPLSIRKPAVALGEDNEYVYRKVLGYSEVGARRPPRARTHRDGLRPRHPLGACQSSPFLDRPHTTPGPPVYIASIAFLHRGWAPHARKESVVESTSNRWVRLAYRWLLPLALAAAIGVAAITVISARSGEGDCDGGDGHGKLGARLSAIAELVGTDADGLKAALGNGKTLAEIAEENGIEAQSVIDALVEKANERIDAAVEAGKLTAEEGETRKSEAVTRIEDMVNNGYDKENFRGRSKGRWRG